MSKNRVAYQREWRRLNSEKAKKHAETYRNKNRDKILKRDRDRRKANPGESSAAVRRYRERNPEKSRLSDRKSWVLTTYGLSWDRYLEILDNQGGVCAICGGPQVDKKAKNFCVYHDHITGEVRGLLCSPCNKGLGDFKDNPVFIDAAAAYVRMNKEKVAKTLIL